MAKDYSQRKSYSPKNGRSSGEPHPDWEARLEAFLDWKVRYELADNLKVEIFRDEDDIATHALWDFRAKDKTQFAQPLSFHSNKDEWDKHFEFLKKLVMDRGMVFRV